MILQNDNRKLTKVEKLEYQHRTEVNYDGVDDEVIFNWHWPRGTFDRRMSAYEIAAFIMPHMPSILPLLGDHKTVQAEFAALLNRLATWPLEALDEVLPWIRRLDFNEEDEILQLNLNNKVVAPKTEYFVMGR